VFLDFFLAVTAELGLILALAVGFRSTIAAVLSDIDTALLKAPLIGPLYETLRKKTYYREDTELMFLDSIPNVVKSLADEVTATKGVKLVRQFERAPILGELYKAPQFGLASGTSSKSQPAS